uniref:RHS repeat-associated core domain-containing protein n=1 Tax=Elaeophora elaphi TaxID=1147741 RepID=A0A0R3RF95_9BILA
MSEYTIRNNSNSGSNNSTGIYSYVHRDKSVLDDNSTGGGIKNDLAKSTWYPNAASSLENKYDRSIFPDGPIATSFEKYVHNIFRPGNKLPKLFAISDNSISARSMLRVQDLLGSAALNESFDDEIMKAPLERMFSEHGLTGTDDYLSYSSSSYYPTIGTANLTYTSTALSPFQSKDNYTAYREKANNDWKRNNKQMIIDYKGSDITPLTPYMYADHPYVRSQDSRIVCSNFVQITSRPNDRFLEKIDRTLAEVRAMPRF